MNIVMWAIVRLAPTICVNRWWTGYYCKSCSTRPIDTRLNLWSRKVGRWGKWGGGERAELAIGSSERDDALIWKNVPTMRDACGHNYPEGEELKLLWCQRGDMHLMPS